jgi:hypothetical protein
MMNLIAANQAMYPAVIVRLDRTIQYAVTSQLEPRRLGLLDTRFRGYGRERGRHV